MTATGPASVLDLPCSADTRVSLAYYAPRSTQGVHAHPFTQISFLLSGHLLERHGRRQWTPSSGAFGCKPAGAPHEDRWGDDGALICSVKLYAGELERIEAQGEPGWSAMEMHPLLPEVLRACLLAPTAVLREEAVWDLLALRRGQPLRRGTPPRWLTSACEAMRDDPLRSSVADVARHAEVHRAHFSTTFRSYYGVPPSVFRRNLLIARAITRVVGGHASLTRVAYDVGFSDQAHLSRSVRIATGLSPRVLRKLFA